MIAPETLRADVVLGELLTQHAGTMYSWMCQEEVRTNLGLRSEPSVEKTLEWIERALRDPSIAVFTVLLDGRYVGNVVVDRIDPYLQLGRLSVYIGEADARHIGVGRTAIRLGLAKAFDTLGLHKVWLIVHTRNYRAINTYMKVGFSIEGLLRDEFLVDGRHESVFYMGILRHHLPR